MMNDFFTPDAFSLTTLTAAINDIPYKPMRLSSLYTEQGISTLDAVIEARNSTLEIIEVEARGTPGQVIQGDKRKIATIRCPHIPARATVMADSVQGIRAFGTDSSTEVLETVVNERLAKGRGSIDITMEAHRMLGLRGQYMDHNGDIQSLFDFFGVTQSSIHMGFSSTTSSKCRSKADMLFDMIEEALGGLTFSGVTAFCGKDFWRDLLEDKDAKETMLNTQMAADLRKDPRQSFSWLGINWERYRGVGSIKVADDEAVATAEGVDGLFITRFAPADYVETVNTIGLPYYGRGEAIGMNKGYAIEMQSNPLNICTRPKTLVKLYRSAA